MNAKKKVVIVGSGIGGLVCGAVLAKEGYQVTVLERNKQIGGCLQIFVRDRHIFDSSVHYVGGLSKGQNLYQIFKYLDIIDDLPIQQLDTKAFDKIYFHSDLKEYSLAQGYDSFAKTLLEEFPGEEKAIQQYIDTIQAVCDNYPLYQLKEGSSFDDSPYLAIDTQAFLQSITSNKRLHDVLAGNNLLYAGVGNKTPLFVHALVENSYIESAWNFTKGSSQVAILLAKVITSHGGHVLKRKNVTQFVEHDDVIDYVETDDGKRYKADFFISNLHPSSTLALTPTKTIRPAYKHRINSLENSVSVFIMYIIFKPKTFKADNSNYYGFVEDDIWNCVDYDEAKWPMSYATFFSKKDTITEYASGATIMTYMKYSEVAEWSETYNTVSNPAERGESYEAFKEKKAQQLLDAVSVKFPEMRASIKSYYTSTPLTYKDYMGTDDGAIYGIMKDYKEPIKTFISPRTKIQNLLLTGQNIKLHGVLGVTLSSIVCCAELLGLDPLLQKIKEAQ